MKTKTMFKTMLASMFCMVALLLVACDGDSNKPVLNKLSFDKTRVDLNLGRTTTLTVKNGTAPYTAKLSGQGDQLVADVRVEGNLITLTGMFLGEATMAVTDKDGNTGVVSVVVKNIEGSLKLDKTTLNIEVGKSETVSVQNGVGPFKALSNDNKVVETDVKGSQITFTGRKAGTTTVEVQDAKSNVGVVTVTVR